MSYPFQNGFLLFTLGILSILSVYHTLLYFQNKDKLYLLYGAYTFFIVLSQVNHIEQGFLQDLIGPIEFIKYYPELYTETYYILYVFFAFKFLGLKNEFPRWHGYCIWAVYFLIFFCFVKFIIYLFSANYEIVRTGYFFFVSFMFVLSIVVYVLFFKMKNPLRYYMIVGSLLLLVTSYSSLFIHTQLVSSNQDPEPAYGILYIGFILENIVFSLGLGQKQKLILKERDHSQQKLILQLQENELLRQKVQQQLKDDVAYLSKTAKTKKMEALKAKYDKELSDLKMTSLRSQMNPHFIFNSLNSIKRYIIDTEKENAVYYLNKFSKLIRKILATTAQKEITLADEMETLELYMNIENIRFNNEIEYSINIDKGLNLGTIKIPSLILQPFLENAIWHGLALKKENKKIAIDLKRHRKSHVKIEIVDNGIGRKRSEEIKQKKIHKRDSMGIKLTRERLSKFSEAHENDYSLTFLDLIDENELATGTKVILKIPIN